MPLSQCIREKSFKAVDINNVAFEVFLKMYERNSTKITFKVSHFTRKGNM